MNDRPATSTVEPLEEPPPPGADAPRRLRHDRIFVTVIALVVLPFLATLVSMIANDWAPTGDDAFVARRTAQVVSARPPLVGQDSTAKADADRPLLNHPGPIAYYVSAGPYAALGWSPTGLLIGVAIVVVGAAVASLWLAERTWGRTGLWCSALTILLLLLRLSPNVLIRPTSSLTVILPLFALLIGLAAFIAGTRAGAVVAVLAANYCLQTSLVVLPFVVLALAGLLGVALVRARQGFRPGRGAAIVGGIVALTWIPPLIQQFTTDQGNLTHLLHYLLRGNADAHATTLGWSKAGRAVSGFVVSLPWTNPIEGTSYHIPSTSILVVAVAAILLGALAWRVRSDQRSLPALVGVATIGIAVAMFSFSKRPHSMPRNPNYMVGWIQAIAAFGWFVFLLTVAAALPALRQRYETNRSLTSTLDQLRVHRSQIGLLVLLALALPTVFYRAPATSSLGEAYDGATIVHLFATSARSAVPAGSVNVVGRGIGNNQLAKGLGVELLRSGFDPRFRELTPMSDEPDTRPLDTAPTLWINDADEPPGIGRAPLTIVTTRNGDRIGLWLNTPDP